MAYVPNNPSVYINAFAGALSALSSSTGILSDASAADYAGIAQAADAVAQKVDTIWGAAPATSVELALIASVVNQTMTGRTPTTGSTQLTSATYNALALAIQAVAVAGNNQINVEGISPPGPLTPTPFTGNIFIDPQNVTGNAKDTNPGTNAAPLKSWAGLVAKWGTITPLITATTTITFLSSHTDNTDPVIARMFVARGGNVTIAGTPITVTNGVVLASTTAKNRAAGSNTLLQTNIGATGAVAQRVVNTTHASVAWVYKNVAGNVFSLTQPLVGQTIGGTLFPAEVDTTANGDSVNLQTLTNVNIVDIEPVSVDGFGSFTLFQLQGFSPGGIGGALMTVRGLGCPINFQECSFQRVVNSDSGVGGLSLVNCIYQGGPWHIAGEILCNGGGVYPSCIVSSFIGTDVIFDADFIVGLQTTMEPRPNLGLVYLDANINLEHGLCALGTQSYGSHVIYGTAGKAITLQGSTKLFLQSGSFTAGITAPGMTGGITLNAVTNASSHTNANNPDVINSNITTSVANLDAAQSTTGFGGTAFRLGGCSITNTV